jgi:hypothetical protein
MTTAAVSDTHEPRSTDRHVTFRTQRSTSPSPYQTDVGNKTPPRSPETIRRNNDRQSALRQQNYARNNYSQNARRPVGNDRSQRSDWNSPRATQASCYRCGRTGGHENPHAANVDTRIAFADQNSHRRIATEGTGLVLDGETGTRRQLTKTDVTQQ